MTSTAPTDLVLTFSFDTWADAVRREYSFSVDRLVVGCAIDPAVGRLLVASAWRSGPRTLARWLQGRRWPPLPARAAPGAIVNPLRLARLDPTDVPGLQRSYCAYDRRLRRASDRLGLVRPAVITANPFVAAFAPLDWAGPVTYYGYDDWSASPPLAAWAPAIDAAYNSIRDRARRVVAVSAAIRDRISTSARSVVVPNGLDPDEWDEPGEVPDGLSRLAHPVILYAGTVDERIDVDMMAEAARRFPDGTLVVVGTVLSPAVLAEIESLVEVRVVGQVPRAVVAGIMRSADVGIIPHRRNRLTEAMSPLKLYEYLAAGLPVVSTDLPPVRGVDGNVVRVAAGDAPAFGDAVEKALASGRSLEDERREFVMQNSWDRRRDAILAVALPPN